MALRGYSDIDPSRYDEIRLKKTNEGGTLVMNLKRKILELLQQKLSAISADEVEKKNNASSIVAISENPYIQALEELE
jgi:hypothetical protein